MSKRGPYAKPGAGLRFLREALSAETNECILWPYGKDKDGYAVVTIDGVWTYAHRYVCEQEHGPPQSGLQSCHSCRQRACINRNHLRWGTNKDNADDRIKDDTNMYGERCHLAKLTEDDVRAIRAAYPAVKQVVLAARYGVSQPVISAILLRKTWKHI